MSYCDFCNNLPSDQPNVHKAYHDYEYGFEVKDDQELFERLILEINQAGLSWNTILNKRLGFQHAYDAFDIEIVAGYTQEKELELLQNKDIIRNKLKVKAAIYNAQAILELQQEHGSFYNWLQKQDFSDLNLAVKIFKKHFKFVGGEIVNEFLMSCGFRQGAHAQNCPIYNKIIQQDKM